MAQIKKFVLKNFKSYNEAALELGPLTLLIGANASGKSNALEGLQMLNWLARGRRLDDVFNTVQSTNVSIRGQIDNLTRTGKDHFGFQCTLATQGWNHLEIEIKISDSQLRILSESIAETNILGVSGTPLFDVKQAASGYSHDLFVAYNNFARGGIKPQVICTDQQAVFTQLLTPARFGASHKKSQKEIPETCNRFAESLQQILFLDPTPKLMRNYSFPTEKSLRGDGSNLSATLYSLCQQHEIKQQVLEFICDLPEQKINSIDFLVGPRGEVMLQLEEAFGNHKQVWDASLLSDGTLRVLAIAAALLSAPEQSMVVIEEIDNGVHPNRARALLQRLEQIANTRQLHVLLTSHNPALLDALPNSSVPNVVLCYRDPEEGDSRLIRLSNLPDYPALIAQGPLGRLVTQGVLDRFVKKGKSPEAKKLKTLDWITELENQPPIVP